MSHVLNTHSYDGKLDKKLIEEIQAVDATHQELLDCGEEILTFINNPIAKKFLNDIINSIDMPANYDPTNNIRAENILFLIGKYKDNPDCIAVLEAQLIDMATGACPQGRTHRLFQVLMSFQ